MRKQIERLGIRFWRRAVYYELAAPWVLPHERLRPSHELRSKLFYDLATICFRLASYAA